MAVEIYGLGPGWEEILSLGKLSVPDPRKFEPGPSRTRPKNKVWPG